MNLSLLEILVTAAEKKQFFKQKQNNVKKAETNLQQFRGESQNK